MSQYKGIIFILLSLLLSACQSSESESDAYGNFEAVVTTISAEANGKLLYLKVSEGEKIEQGEWVGLVDTTALHLQRKQIEASIRTLPQKLRNTLADIQVLEEQKDNLIRERDRVQRLKASKAATQKQLDDLNGQVDVLDKQIVALAQTTQTSNQAILSEKGPMLAQIAIVNEQIRKSYIYNPIKGSILTKLSEPHEMVGMGAPLYRIGQLDTLDLRFYVDAVQLQQLKLGQNITVKVDQGKKEYKQLSGRISWISTEAEFTPKTIQTKEDRVNLVYAVKAKVPNPNGLLKIGMPAEVDL
ncbi:MAG: HlyD family efflux transporter periplasmic adaptor subunit [Bacteroidota bacterium]